MHDQSAQDQPKSFHFISGLPRSGTTLLAAVLVQNPLFHASFQSPVGTMLSVLQNSMGPENESYLQVTAAERERVLRGLFENFYADRPARYVFDQNRKWTANIDLVGKLFPDSIVITMVRNPLAVFESFERMYRANPLGTSRLFNNKGNTHVYQRLSALMDNNGVLGFSLNSFRTAYFSEQRPRLLVITYESFVRAPVRVMGLIHRRLGVPPFSYDFNKVQNLPGSETFDAYLGAPGLHNLKAIIRPHDYKSILPPDMEKSVPKQFWGDGDLSP